MSRISKILVTVLFFGPLLALANYPVSRVFYEYGSSVDDLPSLQPIEQAFIRLGEEEEELLLGDLIRGASLIRSLSHKDLFKLSEVPLHFLKQQKLEGLVAFPDPNDIDPVSGKDLRPPGDTSLTIKIWVSRLGSVSVESDGVDEQATDRLSRQVKKFIDQNEVTGKPITQDTLRALKKFGEHPSRTARVLLSADEKPGEVSAIMKVKQKEDLPHFYFSASNTGSESTGEWIFSGSFLTNQLTGLDDRFSFTYLLSNTAERHGVSANYFIPLVHPQTLSLGVGVGYSTYDASTFATTSIDFEGNTFFLDLAMHFSPLSLDGELGILSLETGLNFENLSAFNSISGSAGFSTINPRLGLKLESVGKNRAGRTSLMIKGNLSSINEDDQLAIGGDETTDTYSRLVLQHLEQLRMGRILRQSTGGDHPYLDRHLLSLRLEASWAMSSRRHLPMHQFITGGSSSVRGYGESIVAGDSGYLFSAEYKVPYFIFDGNNGPLAWSISPFIDIGSTRVNDPRFYESSFNLMGAGLGLEFQLPYGAFARVDFAKPLKELKKMGVAMDGTKSDDYRVHGNLGWKF